MARLLIPDKANCTYWWIMYMDQTHPANKASVMEIHGYSKFQNNAEAKDRNHVLMAKIEMLYKNGYLNRTKKIEIFRKLAPLPDKHEDRLILTLYKNDYVIPIELLPKVPFELKQFLKNFYDAIAHGRVIKNLRPLPDRKKGTHNLFDIKDYHFSKYSELYEWGERQVANGHSAERIAQFIRNYSEQKLDSIDANPLITALSKNFARK